MGTFQPIGAALPPRRDTVQAASAEVPQAYPPSGFGESIHVPLARDRMLEHFEREQLPGDVKSTLAAALNGDLHLQSLLFSAMLDTWPKLQKNINEIAKLASVAPWKVHPYAERGKESTSKSIELAGDVERMIWDMKPRITHGENGFEGTIKALVKGHYYGHTAAEIRWGRGSDGTLQPRCTKTIPARFYGYPYDISSGMTGEDRLMFDRQGGQGARNFEDFPEHRFLIAINRGHEGHATVAAPLRALSGYWLAAVYGLKWFLNFTQLYGIPWRHAEVGEGGDETAVKAALGLIGSQGYIVTKPGVKINILDAAKGGDALPQKALIDLADQQCDQFILGQTLTSGTDKSGSRALGEVHKGTLDSVVDGLVDFVGEILTHQLVPSIVAVNYGPSRTDLPQIWAKREIVKDEKALAERDEKLGITSGKVPVQKSWYYERHGIPQPADGEELLIAPVIAPIAPPAKPPTIKAADASGEWVEFKESLGIPRREMPQIHASNRAAMVSFLRARGINAQAETVDPSKLKATQAKYSTDKVIMAKNYKGGNRSILISEDDRVVDGHHQWVAAVEEGRTIPVIRLMAPIARVLMMAHRMPSTSVAASEPDPQPEDELTIDQLSRAVLEGLTGVAADWLSPVRAKFEKLAALAMAKNVKDEDFIEALETAQKEMPELFELLNTEALQAAFEEAIATAALAGGSEGPSA